MLTMKSKLSANLQTQPNISHHNLLKLLCFLSCKRKERKGGGRERGRKERKLNIIYITNLAQKFVILKFSMSNMKQQQKRPSRTSYKIRQFIYLAYTETLSV